ncbi:MAG: sodium:alanine symporter family protein [Prevotella sp.]|nr:sodium:alanine symporter family protein [Prevotella sp.]
MDIFNDIISSINNVLWGWPMIILLLGTHLYLTFILKFPQRKIFKAIKLSLSKDKDATGDVSQFGALATALAATIGTGNIVGVGIAIALGGPGAVFWCWLTGVFGISTKYAEGLLAIKYRVKTSNGQMLGGPMYALERGLGWKWMGMLFALFCTLASFGIGCTVQANAISTLTNETFHISPYIIGALVCVLTAAVILGGVKSIARVCTAFVPFMAIFYVVGCIYILGANHSFLWPALKVIVESAFNPEAAGGGFVGGSIMIVARYGISRGLFSNESGMGSAPIVAAAAQTRNPVRQALVSSSGTFWDTVVICALTGLVIVSSALAHPDISYTDGATLTKAAFSKIPYVGAPLLNIGQFTFAFSTILGWCYYGERGIEYLGGKRMTVPYRVAYIIAVFAGSVISLSIVWNIADCFNALMAIPNLLSLIFLSKILVKETNHYLWNDHLDEEMNDEELLELDSTATLSPSNKNKRQ